MAEGLVAALDHLDLETQDDWIDSILDEQRPPKRIKQNRDELEQELEQKYLTPSTTFSTEWLNKLQQ